MTVGMSTFYYIDYWGRKEIIEMWQLLDDAWPLIERGISRVNKLMTSFRPSFFFFSFFSLVLHGCTYYSNASPICVISQDKCNDVTRWSKFVQNFDKKFHTLFRTAEKIFSVTKKNLLIDEILLQLYSYELKYSVFLFYFFDMKKKDHNNIQFSVWIGNQMSENCNRIERNVIEN